MEGGNFNRYRFVAGPESRSEMAIVGDIYRHFPRLFDQTKLYPLIVIFIELLTHEYVSVIHKI